MCGMADPYDFTPFEQHLRNVLSDYKGGGLDGLDDAVQAILDHPELRVAWDDYQKAHPVHGLCKKVGGRPMWWNAIEQVWKWEPVE